MACNQTPVAVLQELCVHRRWNPPHYEVTNSGGTPNDPTYEMTVTLHNGIIAKGLGRQKKEAKHDAAQKALMALQVPALTDGSTPLKSPTLSKAPVNPHKDAGILNAVGELQELCASKHLPEPKYTVVGDEGEPHEKVFTYRVTVSERQETGRARKKQTAKQLAAQNMLTVLQGSLKDFLEEIPNDPAVSLYSQKAKEKADQQLKEMDDEIIEKYKHLKAECKVLPIVSPGLRFNEYHLAYKDQLVGLGDLVKSPSFINERDSVRRLEMIVASLNRKITTTMTVGRNREHIVFMVVDTQPSAVQAGHGERMEEAEQKAASNLIEFLKLMAF